MCDISMCDQSLAMCTHLLYYFRTIHTIVYYIHLYVTRWRRCIGYLKLQVSFRQKATNHRALWREMTYRDKAYYSSSPPSILHTVNRFHILLSCVAHEPAVFHLYMRVTTGCLCVCEYVCVCVCVCVCTRCIAYVIGRYQWVCVCVFVCVCARARTCPCVFASVFVCV